MDTTSIVMYLVVFALCILFSSFSIDLKKLEWSLLAMICWFAFALLNVGLETNKLFASLSYLYFGLGIYFMVYGFAQLFMSFTKTKEEQREREWEVVD